VRGLHRAQVLVDDAVHFTTTLDHVALDWNKKTSPTRSTAQATECEGVHVRQNSDRKAHV
jgi:hypothetical protein